MPVRLSSRLVGKTEVYRFSVRIKSTNGNQAVMVGWAPGKLPLGSPQYCRMGYYASAYTGCLTTNHQAGATIPNPSLLPFGKLPQDGVITCIYNRTKGTLSFQWQGGKAVIAYSKVPCKPQLFPAVLFANEGDCVELLPSE